MGMLIVCCAERVDLFFGSMIVLGNDPVYIYSITAKKDAWVQSGISISSACDSRNPVVNMARKQSETMDKTILWPKTFRPSTINVTSENSSSLKK